MKSGLLSHHTMKHILFLDIDGVLVTRRSIQMRKLSNGLHRFDPQCVAAFKAFLIEVDVAIVLSSAWRYRPAELLVRHFEAHGLPGPKERTPTQMELRAGWVLDEVALVDPLGHANTRGFEIRTWLRANGEPSSYAVVDDDVSDIVGTPERPNVDQSRVVGTSFEHGFTVETARLLWRCLESRR